MIRCAKWKHVVEGSQGSLSTTRCCANDRDYTAQVICYPGGGRCFGYVWGPHWIEMSHGPTYRKTAIRLLSMLRRKAG